MAHTIGSEPLLLQTIDSQKSWGSEVWLNPARAEASARVVNLPGTPRLASLIAQHPALVGPWSRALVGDGLPIFTKFLRTHFPPFVHVGFRRDVTAAELNAWLQREQALLRQLLAVLRVDTREDFDAFAKMYTAWAIDQALAAWKKENEAPLVTALAAFFAEPHLQRVTQWLVELRRNRAAFVDTLNEVDLRKEDGNLIVTRAGIMHAIFGLSHQTHPQDASGDALRALHRQFKTRVAAGAGDADLMQLIDAADLPALRARNHAEPKNEAWYPTTVGGGLTLVEPQQSSDTTYSLADFYTPFVWDEKIRFRKGHASEGLADAQLAEFVDGLDRKATPIAVLRRTPIAIAAGSNAQARLYSLIDDATDWPFFAAHRLELAGSVNSPATWRGDHGPGLFQQLVLVNGEVELHDAANNAFVLSPTAPAFIPATMTGGYRLEANGPATLLFFSVPGPHESIRYDANFATKDAP